MIPGYLVDLFLNNSFFFSLFEFRMYAVNERKLMRISAWRHILFPRFCFFFSLSLKESRVGSGEKGGGGVGV